MVKNKNWFLKTIPSSGINQLVVSFQVLWPLSNMPYISSDRKWPKLPFPVVGLFILMPPSKSTKPSILHIKVKPLIIDWFFMSVWKVDLALQLHTNLLCTLCGMSWKEITFKFLYCLPVWKLCERWGFIPSLD